MHQGPDGRHHQLDGQPESAAPAAAAAAPAAATSQGTLASAAVAAAAVALAPTQAAPSQAALPTAAFTATRQAAAICQAPLPSSTQVSRVLTVCFVWGGACVCSSSKLF